MNNDTVLKIWYDKIKELENLSIYQVSELNKQYSNTTNDNEKTKIKSKIIDGIQIHIYEYIKQTKIYELNELYDVTDIINAFNKSISELIDKNLLINKTSYYNLFNNEVYSLLENNLGGKLETLKIDIEEYDRLMLLFIESISDEDSSINYELLNKSIINNGLIKARKAFILLNYNNAYEFFEVLLKNTYGYGKQVIKSIERLEYLEGILKKYRIEKEKINI